MAIETTNKIISEIGLLETGKIKFSGYFIKLEIVKIKFKNINFFYQFLTNNLKIAFILAASNKEKLTKKKKIEQAFKLFDENGDGVIEKQEIEGLMGGKIIDESTWKEILGECDKNGDGKVFFFKYNNSIYFI